MVVIEAITHVIKLDFIPNASKKKNVEEKNNRKQISSLRFRKTSFSPCEHMSAVVCSSLKRP